MTTAVEGLIVFVIIIILLFIAGISVEVIMLGLLALMALMLLALLVFFCFCIFRLLRCERTEGRVLKIEKHPKYGYGMPFYEIGGEEYANVFPCEVVMKKQLYTLGRRCRLYLDRKRSKVFDGNAAVSSVAGFFLTAASFALLVFQIKNMFGGADISLFR